MTGNADNMTIEEMEKKKQTKNCHTGDRTPPPTAMLPSNDLWQEFVCLA